MTTATSADSLAGVRSRLKARALRVSGRVGTELAGLISANGKLLRARFTLLLGEALGVPEEAREHAACAIEWVHNASLLHDDCVDEAALRRGLPTPNAVFGRSVALLLGDLAFSQGLEEAQEISQDAANTLVSAVREMTIGELQEEFLRGSTAISKEAYLGVASRKTGALFEWVGQVLAKLSPHELKDSDPARMGLSSGILLQVVDDILDLSQNARRLGKKPGQDIAQRQISLPLVYAFEDASIRARFEEAWSKPGEIPDAELARLSRLAIDSGAVKRARATASELLASILAAARALPRRPGALRLLSFVEEMAARDY
jgi:octaprenyl-diphosphate synthase